MAAHDAPETDLSHYDAELVKVQVFDFGANLPSLPCSVITVARLRVQ